MYSPELRSIILNLHHRLSDHDRQRLHFYLKNHVPRDIGDDSTLNGTLKLMDSLFDQAKISEQNFTFLINAFKQIQRLDAVQLLKGRHLFFQTIYLITYYSFRL
jgi:hypothetical protein